MGRLDVPAQNVSKRLQAKEKNVESSNQRRKKSQHSDPLSQNLEMCMSVTHSEQRIEHIQVWLVCLEKCHAYQVSLLLRNYRHFRKYSIRISKRHALGWKSENHFLTRMVQSSHRAFSKRQKRGDARLSYPVIGHVDKISKTTSQSKWSNRRKVFQMGGKEWTVDRCLWRSSERLC